MLGRLLIFDLLLKMRPSQYTCSLASGVLSLKVRIRPSQAYAFAGYLTEFQKTPHNRLKKCLSLCWW